MEQKLSVASPALEHLRRRWKVAHGTDVSQEPDTGPLRQFETKLVGVLNHLAIEQRPILGIDRQTIENRVDELSSYLNEVADEPVLRRVERGSRLNLGNLSREAESFVQHLGPRQPWQARTIPSA